MLCGLILTAAVPEPESKQRKTLAERAGETFGSKIAAPQTSRPTNNAVKQSVSNGSRGFSNSLSRSTSTRAPKHKTSSSGSSVGHGSRAPSANTTRPKSAYGGHNRSRSQYQRPATSMAQHDPEPEPQGGHPISISTNPSASPSMLHVQKNSFRESASRTFSLNISSRQRPPTQRSVSSPSSQRPRPEAPVSPADTDCDDILTELGALTLRASIIQARTSRTGRGATAGKNLGLSYPSQIPKQTPTRSMPPPSLLALKSPRKQRSPITPFLNKYTNDRVPVFDDTRVASLEAQFAAWKEQMEIDMDKQSKVQESIKLYETKSECELVLFAPMSIPEVELSRICR